MEKSILSSSINSLISQASQEFESWNVIFIINRNFLDLGMIQIVKGFLTSDGILLTSTYIQKFN